MHYRAFTPGQVWLDTGGNRIQAHGGSIIYLGDTFYWYGENKEKSLPGSGVWHWGVRCYASKDLYNWEDKGIIIPPDPNDSESPLHPSKCMDRPHIIYNRFTKKFVCWLKIMESTNVQAETILTADNLLGPYTMVRKGYQPLGMNAGDFDLVVNPSDGKAYYYFERVHTELICADLTEDYTQATGYYSSHFPRKYPPFVREAPAYFYRKSLHYLFTSGTTGYHPNPSEAACAELFHGPWRLLGNPHTDDPAKMSYNSQITSVFKHPHKKDLYIALADRWMPDLPGTPGIYESVAARFEAIFNPDANKPVLDEPIGSIHEINTSVADYVWLPVRFEGEMAYLDWQDEWRLEDYA